MKTIRKVEITPVFVEQFPETYQQNFLYISEKYKTSSHLCLCGCGEITIMPFSDNDSRWWKLIKEKDGKVSFIGSVGNYSFKCQSHYIITKNVANFV